MTVSWSPTSRKYSSSSLRIDGADRETAEFARWKTVFSEERQPHIGGQVQVRRIRQVPVEIHGAPPGKKVLAISTVRVRHTSVSACSLQLRTAGPIASLQVCRNRVFSKPHGPKLVIREHPNLVAAVRRLEVGGLSVRQDRPCGDRRARKVHQQHPGVPESRQRLVRADVARNTRPVSGGTERHHSKHSVPAGCAVTGKVHVAKSEPVNLSPFDTLITVLSPHIRDRLFECCQRDGRIRQSSRRGHRCIDVPWRGKWLRLGVLVKLEKTVEQYRTWTSS